MEEEANSIYFQKIGNNYRNGNQGNNADSTVSQLNSKGYTIERIGTSGSAITGISLDKNYISMSNNGTNSITVNYEESTGDLFYAVVEGKYYLMKFSKNKVKVYRSPTEINSTPGPSQLTATSSDGCITIGSINGNVININSGANPGKSTITVRYGNFEASCLATISPTPTTASVPNGNVTFSTDYGRIEVIWLSGTGKTVSSTPNAPVLAGMTPVSWTLNGDAWEEDETPSSSYYDYVAGEGFDENTSSRWANAKDSNHSYFVWIPRYAYRITYYENQDSNEPTGFYDGWGQWRASDGSLRCALDSGIETVEYDGKKYIVHPAFCGTSVGYDNGSWSENITGFWISKYPMSYTNSESGYIDVSVPSRTYPITSRLWI